MRLGSSELLRLAGSLVLLAMLVGVAPAAADWSAAAPVPVVQPFSAYQASVDAELADNGDAAIAWGSTGGDAIVATRTAGTWARETLPFGGGNPEVEGDGRGNLAVAWHSDTYVCAGYRPAGGEWEFPPSRTQCFGEGSAYAPVNAHPGLSVNRRGDVLLTWLQNTDPPFDAMASIRRAATGAWGPAGRAATNLIGTDDRRRPGVAGAIDDAGNALVVWDAYYRTVDGDDKVSAVRVGMRPAGASGWSAPQDVTPVEPGPDGCAGHPSWFGPRLAVDPVSGAIAIAYYGSDDYYSEVNGGCSPSGDTAIVWAGGSTTAGASGGTRSPPYRAAVVAGAPGWLMGAATTSNPNPNGVLAAVGPSGNLSPSAVPGSDQGTGDAMIDVGARGRALIWRDGMAWLSGPQGAFSAPAQPVLPQGQGDYRFAGVSLNCHGAALVSAPRASDGDVYFSEHPGASGDADCGSAGGGDKPPPDDGDPPQGGGSDPPPPGVPPAPQQPAAPPIVIPATATITARASSALAKKRVATLATIECPSGATCTISAAKRKRLAIRGKRFRVKVLGTGTIAAGATRRLRVRFTKKAVRRLKKGSVTIELPITTTVNGVARERTLEVKVRGAS